MFVCGSGKGMGEGVEAALIDVAMAKGNLNAEEAKLFWDNKMEAGQYIAVSSLLPPPMSLFMNLTNETQETW